MCKCVCVHTIERERAREREQEREREQKRERKRASGGREGWAECVQIWEPASQSQLAATDSWLGKEMNIVIWHET